MLVKFKDLNIGDEILVPSLNTFKRLKVLQQPQLDKQGYYKSIKCAIRNENLNGKWANYNCENPEYNDQIRLYLSHKSIWLINSETKI